ncbi:MAG: hypothetical protein IT546_11155 [Caulobacteraceae bacterium]|nr:hypothetical protein [Caulobacteraceae bacterium]
MAGPFELSLQQFAEHAIEDVDQTVNEIVLALHARVVELSPVDTGWFRAHWGYGLDNYSAAPAPAPPRPKDHVRGKNIHGDAPLPALTKGNGIGHVHYLFNAVPYARRLEYGSSLQAPNGMVRITIAEFQQMVDRIAGGRAG